MVLADPGAAQIHGGLRQVGPRDRLRRRRRRRRRRRDHRERFLRWSPAGQSARERLPDLVRRDVADDGDGRRVRAVTLAMKAHDLVAIELPHRLDGAGDGVRVRMPRVDEPRQRPPRHHLRILLGALERGLDLGHLAP